MPPRHLSCPSCRIRVRADAPEIDLLEGRCPICAAPLRAAVHASGVMGFRSFDLGPLSGEDSDDGPDVTSSVYGEAVAKAPTGALRVP